MIKFVQLFSAITKNQVRNSVQEFDKKENILDQKIEIVDPLPNNMVQ